MADTQTLTPDHDPMGAAIRDYLHVGRASTLRVLSTMFDEDEMPVAHLFRSAQTMPPLERRALALARGRVLDVGAGAGCHALALQERGLEVKAIDISPLSVEAMRERGVADAECINLYDTRLGGRFDTILLLMNGTGIAGRVDNLPRLLDRLRSLMADGAQVLVDSSDLRYIFEDEDGNLDLDDDQTYYGEVDYQMIYDDVEGLPFRWLYVDFPLLKAVAATCGLKAELVAEGEQNDYLARLTL